MQDGSAGSTVAAVIGEVFAIVAMVAVYLLPAWLGRRRRDFRSIVWFDLLLGWTAIGWIVALIWALRAERIAAPTHICAACWSRVRPVSGIKGSFGVELILWLCFILPGLIYSIWRMSSRTDWCPVCKGATLIPLGAPAASALLARTNAAN